MLSAGKLAVKVHSASGLLASPTATEPDLGPRPQVYCVCEVPGFGRLCTEPSDAGATPDDPTEWEQELTFEVGPSAEAKQLKVALYEVTPGEAGTDEFIGSGSMNLAHLEEVQQQHHVRVPVVSPAGAHLADLSLDLRWYYTRNPARQRDEQGREYIDRDLMAAGPSQAARLLNERSCNSPNGSPRPPRSPRLKPPPHDPSVPELPVFVRTTLGGEE